MRQMPKGKCIILSGDNEDVKAQLNQLSRKDRKEVADFRRLLRKLARSRDGKEKGR